MKKKRTEKKQKKKKQEHLATGIIRMHARGFGFLQSNEKEKYPEDIFIPKNFTKGAIDGDLVEARVNVETPSEKGLDGAVVKILKRSHSHVGGTLTRIHPKGGGFAYVPLIGSNSEMKIEPYHERKLQVGDRVVIKVLDWGSQKKESLGRVSSYIGNINDPTCDVKALVEEFDLPREFSQEVIEEAERYGNAVTKKEIEEREDLRDLVCFTIDPNTAKDFDDALSLTQDETGRFHLGVHIADVSFYVKPGTELDLEAKKRCNSTYFPGEVIPMLPHALSSHLCSLKPHVNRLAISVMMTLDAEGNLLNYRFTKSVIRSAKRFTYEEAKEVLDGKRKSPFVKDLFLMVDLCHRLKNLRSLRGSIEFSLPSTQVIVDDKGMPVGLERVEYDITHQLVEEFMLKANEIVATHLAKEGKPLTYRIHDEPNIENMRDFALLARSFGFSLSKDPETKELQDLFDKAQETPFGGFLATAFIRSMKLASYSVQNIGHYGLGLEYYTHFTSPIRRYIDLVVHRVLFNEIKPDEKLEQIALECSEKERLSAKAEGSVTLLKKLRLLENFQSKQPEAKYDAVVTHVKSFGIIFEVIDFLLEGFLPLSALYDDYFIFDEKTKQLIGKHSGKHYQAGEKIQVMLSDLDLITQETRWALAEERKRKRR